MNNKEKMLAVALASAAIGAIVGILYAPAKGSETRKKIKEKGQGLGNNLKSKFKNFEQKLDDLKENMKQTKMEKKNVSV